jgi:hypothetical protein
MATPTFLSAINVSDAGQDGFEAQTVVDSSGNAHAVWTRSDGSHFVIQYGTRTPSGAWSPAQTLSDPSQSASSPQIGIDPSGNAVVVWTRTDGTNLRIQSAYKPSGGSFGVPVTVSAAGGDASSPQVSMDGAGKALVAWQRFDGTNLRVQAAIRAAGTGGAFGAASTLSLGGRDAFAPTVAAGPDADNNGNVCWTRTDGTNLRVQCSRRRDVTGFPRPKGATPTRIALVPAFTQCTSGNRTHGPALAFPSCNPPSMSSSVLTTGAPDSNGFASNMLASVRYRVIAGNTATEADEADVNVITSISDVRNNPGGSDYTGKVLVTSDLTITDNNNAAETPESGTVQTIKLEWPVQCVATTSTSIGGQCDLNTTVDALVPGAVLETKRSIWALGEVTVQDAGVNGTGYASCPPTCGDGDETTYLRQGVFVP